MNIDKDYVLKAIGDNLRRARIARGLSLRQMSSLCTSDHSDINRIEKGHVNLGVLKLVELCAVLQVDPGEIISLSPGV